MKKMKLVPVLIAVLALFIFAAPVSADILDATTCSGIGGTWEVPFVPSGDRPDYLEGICTVSGAVTISSDITIPFRTTLALPWGSSSITINIGVTIANNGYINNSGTISGGTINNSGEITNNAGGIIGNAIDICGHGRIPIIINNHGVINNYGTINNGDGIIINNYGTINNNVGSIIGNCYPTIINNYGTINNGGTISGSTITNKCGGIINGIDENEIVQEPCTPAEAIQYLIDNVRALNLQHGVDNSLDAKLDAAKQALLDVNTNNNAAAINALEAFINAVTAQRGKAIPESNADTLIAAAQRIIDELRSA